MWANKMVMMVMMTVMLMATYGVGFAVVIRSHASNAFDAVYCDRCSLSVVCLSVSLSHGGGAGTLS